MHRPNYSQNLETQHVHLQDIIGTYIISFTNSKFIISNSIGLCIDKGMVQTGEP
jgi:hypothetical protein